MRLRAWVSMDCLPSAFFSVVATRRLLEIDPRALASAVNCSARSAPTRPHAYPTKDKQTEALEGSLRVAQTRRCRLNLSPKPLVVAHRPQDCKLRRRRWLGEPEGKLGTRAVCSCANLLVCSMLSKNRVSSGLVSSRAGNMTQLVGALGQRIAQRRAPREQAASASWGAMGPGFRRTATCAFALRAAHGTRHAALNSHSQSSAIACKRLGARRQRGKRQA
jgi:hypothetical protein